MKIWINGELVEADGATNVAELADRLGFQPHTVLIELNATALHQREWRERPIAEGDRIEVLRVVAGG
jgi:thiamine biosynthesis protein ThiS